MGINLNKEEEIVMPTMTRKQFKEISFNGFMEWAYENIDEVTTEENLKQFAIEKIENDDFGMGLHILNAIYENPFNTEWYRYDYSMGTLETPIPITEKEDISDLIEFE